MLWNRSLVMRDLETGSLWSHILGECKAGPLLDASLEMIPSTMATWGEWKKQYPETTVLNLDRTAGRFKREFYERPEHFVYGVKVNGTPKAYPFDVLLQENISQDTIKDKPVLVVFDPKSTMAFVYERIVNDSETAFSAELEDGLLKDSTTGSYWNPWSGEAVKGQSTGQKLPRLYGIISYRSAWEMFYPKSLYAD